MLRHLHISGLGVIDDVDLPLHPGLNVLTGETGAGKTLVTAGLSLVTGSRASASLVAPRHRAAKVQASFDAPPGTEEWEEDGALLLSRSVGTDGRSTVRIGGQLATVSTLAEVGGRLVEVHGQHAGRGMLTPAAQTALLDRFAGDALVVAVAGVRERFERWSALRGELEELQRASRDRERAMDLLAYQVREIEAVDPRPHESEELAGEESRLGHVERLSELARLAHEDLVGDRGAADLTAVVAERLRQAATMDPATAELASRAASIAAETTQLASDVRTYAGGLQSDPERLEHVRARQALLATLRRKYGDTDEEVIAFGTEAAERLGELEGADERAGSLERATVEARADLDEQVEVVTASRRRSAPALARAITSELEQLGMDGARVGVELHDLSEIGPYGSETVDVTLTPGPRQAAVSVSHAASGGELSRTFLAIRSVLADLDEVPTLVFDEVDAGIGGRAGLAVGRRLARLAAQRQVLVVTHLPQIACFADHHVMVTKDAGTATVRSLDGPDRVRELSRMLAGLDRSQSAEEHAEELLLEADRARAEPR